jgi:hypothetical protein
MSAEDLRSILERLGAIHLPCDLDVVVFFHRHPTALLTSEQIAAFLGYDREQVATSIDGLIQAGLLRRSQNPTRAARLYTLERDGVMGGSLERLLAIAGTRRGRREVIQLLQARSNSASNGAGERVPSISKVA